MSVVEVFVDVHAALAQQIAIAIAAVVMTHARRIDVRVVACTRLAVTFS